MNLSIFASVVILLALAQSGQTVEIGDFYDFERDVRLENGANKGEFVKLDTPINFFSDIYDHIYINTQGILTFGVDLNSFLNVPFPLEYPSIAPFYSNVDTTNAGPETSISLSKLSTERNERLAADAIRRNFAVGDNFRVVSVVVATWEKVGHYRENNTHQNSFQVAIICGEQDTFVEFLYPTNGIQWLQGDQGESGLPDIRAQAGFVAEDGRFFTVTGSGTDNVKYLNALSNNGRPGSWIFRIGHLGFEQNIEEPDQSHFFQQEIQHPRSCDSGGHLKCHISAICRDTRLSFMCECKSGHYGNGYNCIKNDVPLRVAGRVTGKINNAQLDAQLQSYVVLNDGRSYTAISPLDNSIGYSTQLTYAFGSVIGWLFAKPIASDNAPNGYQLTGGKLNHTATIRFTGEDGTTHELLIVQRFNGLNVWDQLAVDIEVNGNLPDVRSGAAIVFPDSSDSYMFQTENKIQSNGNGAINVDGRPISFVINQVIDFETFREQSGEPLNTVNTQPLFNKVSKISAQYQERETALRIGMINKVVRNSEINPCTDGTATCHQDSMCVPDPPNDSYLCECKNGFTYDESAIACVDIDECATNSNICDANAECTNKLGGYECRCLSGFYGNGYTCYPEVTGETTEESSSPSPAQCQNGYYFDESRTTCVDIDECTQYANICGQDADCINRVGGYDCQCRSGFYRRGPKCYPENESDTTTEESSTTLPVRCQSGYYYNESMATCVDIDECIQYGNICGRDADCINRLGGYDCHCRSGFYRSGTTCYPDGGSAETTEEPDTSTRETNNSGVPPDHWLCDQCSEYADCNNGVCKCRNGWSGDGIECIYNCPDDSVWENDRCVTASEEDELEVAPFCHSQGCTCPTGYEMIETVESKTCRLSEKEEDDEKLPCDMENTCHQNAKCEWVESEMRNKCVCNPGFEGNGYECVELEVSCLIENICDVNAECRYEELIGKSVCKCNEKYVGDGRTCQLEPECELSSDCAENSYCSRGICVCNEGYERNATSEICVPAGYCGAALCAKNAVCLWDNVQDVQYCACPDGYVGDGLQSCKLVTPPCNVKNNCGLNAQCVANTNNTYECTCNSGFYGDGFLCVEEINCKNAQLCHEQGRCIKTSSGYQCVCNSGYIGNGTYCTEPFRQEHGFLLLSQGVAILKFPTDQLPIRGNPIAMSSMAIGIDKDCTTGRVYWSDISTKQIYSSKYNGSDKKTFISEDIVSPEGVAVDWISRRLYWTDSSKDTIEVASLDDPKKRTVVVHGNLVNPRGIAVDPRANKLYWSDWNRENPKIEQSDLDGTNRVILLRAPAINLPNSLAISTRSGELCYADAGTQKIECIEPYRGTVRTVAVGLSYPFGLTVTNERLYWTDWTTKKIESSDEQGVRYPGIVNPLFGSHKMYGVTAVTSDCELFFSQCLINNGDCPSNSICLINPVAPSGRFCKPLSNH